MVKLTYNNYYAKNIKIEKSYIYLKKNVCNYVLTAKAACISEYKQASWKVVCVIHKKEQTMNKNLF